MKTMKEAKFERTFFMRIESYWVVTQNLLVVWSNSIMNLILTEKKRMVHLYLFFRFPNCVS